MAEIVTRYQPDHLDRAVYAMVTTSGRLDGNTAPRLGCTFGEIMET